MTVKEGIKQGKERVEERNRSLRQHLDTRPRVDVGLQKLEAWSRKNKPKPLGMKKSNVNTKPKGTDDLQLGF